MKCVTIYTELYSSKNSRQIFRTKTGKPFITKSAVSKRQEIELVKMLKNYTPEWKTLTGNQKYPLQIDFKIYRQTHRRFDYVNIVQNLLDCMVIAGWLPDDSADYIIPSFSHYEVDKNEPRVILTIK